MAETWFVGNEYEGRPIIYTTGAYLSPKKFRKENGEILWGWIVERFEEDSFFDGIPFNPDEFAETKTELCRNRYAEEVLNSYEPIDLG